MNSHLPIPIIEYIHQRIYAAVSRPAALNMKYWHLCQTSHCRAGWVVILAGEAGKAVENFYGTELAAKLIYKASGYAINPRRFFDEDDASLADMKSLAEEEQLTKGKIIWPTFAM